jgi:sensor c-di-GMP phosphodiesterase-like protein
MTAQPFAFATSGVLACMAIGLGVGLWAGVATLHDQIEDDTGRLAQLYIERADAVGDDIVQALTRIRQSPAAPCSDADLAWLRRIVIESRHIKSAVRLHDREMLCSSTLGKLPAPTGRGTVDFETSRGRRVLVDTPLIGMPGVRGMVIEEGNASVVLNREAFVDKVDPRLDYTVVADYDTRRDVFISNMPPAGLALRTLVSGEPVTVDGRRFEVRCSTAHTGCIVAALRDRPRATGSPLVMAFGLFGLVGGLGGGVGLVSAIARSRSLSRRLRAALGNNELTVVYQPIVRLADRERVGAESLIRWRDTEGHAISPDVFIAVAEEEGFISEVTRFVLRRVMAELADGLRQRPGFRVTVNLSAKDVLDPTFAGFVRHELQAAGVSPGAIGFELTERSTADHDAIGRGIQALRKAGHAVYIDDFGTDYSSLSYLAQLQVDMIKIDRSFTLALQEGAEQSLMPQIVAMARTLSLGLVIEGIETDAQARIVAGIDRDALGQGWLFGSPVEASRLFDAG